MKVNTQLTRKVTFHISASSWLLSDPLLQGRPCAACRSWLRPRCVTAGGSMRFHSTCLAESAPRVRSKVTSSLTPSVTLAGMRFGITLGVTHLETGFGTQCKMQ